MLQEFVDRPTYLLTNNINDYKPSVKYWENVTLSTFSVLTNKIDTYI